MNSLAIFLLCLTLAWILATLLPVFWHKAVNISLSLALLTNLIAAGFSAAIWLGFLKWEMLKIPVNWWAGIDVVIQNQTLPPLQLEFILDTLSAFFIFLVTSFSALVAVYSFKALQARHYRDYAHWITSAFNIFTWSTVMVLVAHDGVSLLISLELMTLSFGYLVLYKHFLYQDDQHHIVEPEKQRNAFIAPQVYLMISHASTVFLLLAILLLAIQTGGWSYQDFAKNSHKMQTKIDELNLRIDELKKQGISLPQGPERKSLLDNVQRELNGYIVSRNEQVILLTAIFLFSLVGLGIRAGLTPAHVWVSLVHPSSPTTTHALSLGIAIKVAIYLMYRFFFQFLPPQAWWGYLLLAVAIITALANVWYAISSHDLKEALAYHSIENIGIICVGIGFGLIFWNQSRSLAYLGLIASLYHLLNHAVFKGLLYLATGAIDNLTHQTVDIDRLGGLIHTYGYTASMFLIGSFSISGFPPLNGFISEWLVLQTGLIGFYKLHGDDITSLISSLAILLSLLLLVASFALTVFCFYKMAGIALLGMPRLSEDERTEWEKNDVHFTMKWVMGLMAFLCLFLGTLPSVLAPQLVKAFNPLQMPDNFWDQNQAQWYQFQLPPQSVPFAPENYSLSLQASVVIILLLGIAAIFRWRFHSHVETRQPELPWSCGEPLQKMTTHQYTSGALSFSFRKLFGIKGVVSSTEEYLPANMVLSKSPNNQQYITEIFRYYYNQVIGVLLGFSEELGKEIQNRDIRSYLKYVFWVTIIVFFLYWLTTIMLKGV